MRTFRLGSLAKLRFHYCYHVCINRELERINQLCCDTLKFEILGHI